MRCSVAGTTRTPGPWYRRAADEGDAEAAFGLAVLHADRGDSQAALAWYERAAEGGDPRAMYNFATHHALHGDPATERYWWRRAAEATPLPRTTWRSVWQVRT
ncbi:hypothetical protein ACIQZO_22195 [Streptomyces sp. NPDC097617]|uniref:hypothetical protein n=1 Tax=Streptomyces sp. NPDC097617 TaxID=3366091 RepID=UPI003800A027